MGFKCGGMCKVLRHERSDEVDREPGNQTKVTSAPFFGVWVVLLTSISALSTSSSISASPHVHSNDFVCPTLVARPSPHPHCSLPIYALSLSKSTLVLRLCYSMLSNVQIHSRRPMVLPRHQPLLAEPLIFNPATHGADCTLSSGIRVSAPGCGLAHCVVWRR